jgi:hypothetical protein
LVFWRDLFMMLVLIGPAGDVLIGSAGDVLIGPAGDVLIGPAGDVLIGPAGDVHQSDEYYSDPMCLLSASSLIPDTPLAFVGVLSVPVPSSDLLPIPSDKCGEVPRRKALRDRGAERLRVATDTEVSTGYLT